MPLIRLFLRTGCLALLTAVVLTACTHTSTTPSVPPTPAAASASVKPGINDNFLNPDLDVDQWTERFEREGREIYDQRHEIVAAMGLKPGMAVADIGAGSGLFSALFASEVGEGGRVYAVDIAAPFVERIRQRAAEAGLTQVTGVVCTDRSTELPKDSVDAAFICDTYHHFEHPAETMASLHRALRRNGELLVIDFHRIPGKTSDWTLSHVRAGQEVFTQEIEAAGFRKVDELALLKDNYVLRFRKVGR